MNTILRHASAALLFGFVTSGWGAVCAPPPSEIVAWWPADGNSDDIVGGNAGVLRNGADYAAGIVGEAFGLRATTSAYVSSPSSPSLNMGLGDFSIETWIKTSSHKNIQTIQDKREGPHQVGYHFIVFGTGILGGTLAFQINDVNASFQSWVWFDLADGEWHHVAVSVDRGTPNGIHMYVDGDALPVEIGGDFSAVTGSIDTSVPLLIGGHSYDNDVNSFDGNIDEFTLYKRALSEDEIKSIYTAGALGKCRGPSFATFTPRAEFTLGPKANDDSYWARGWLRLAEASNGINPMTESVTIKLGTFSHTIPAGSFVQDGSAYKYVGTIGPSTIDVSFWPKSTPGVYWFKSCLKNGNLEATTMKPQVQLTIGDDSGQATLDVGYAKFGRGADGQKWVFPPAK